MAPKNISETKNWLNWKGNLGNLNDSKDDCEVDDESDIEPGGGIKDLESAEHRVVDTALNVPGLFRST